MTTERTLPETLRDLAERRVPCVQVVSGADRCICGAYTDDRCSHVGTVPDPRFAALRGEHETYGTSDDPICWHLDDWDAPYCLRTDLGAIVEAAAACGLTVSGLGYRTTALGAKGWICDLRLSDTPSAYWWEGVSPDGTPAEAAGRALAAWVEQQEEQR